MELILTSVIAFASTNIDDIFILTVFFANKDYPDKSVVVGQYIGIITLITISFIGSLIGLLIEQQYIGLLGLLPIFFGIRGVVHVIQRKDKEEEAEEKVATKASNKMLSVAPLTIANGGDNIGIYIPLFATLTIGERLIMISIFLVMVAVWCFAAIYLSKHKAVANTLGKYGHIITPFVLIALGVYILLESGSFSLLR